MKGINLSVRLIGAFAFVALITLAVGFIGWSGTARIKDHVDYVAGQSLPAIEHLLTFRQAAESIRVAQRTLLSPRLDEQTRQRQYENVARARENCAAAGKAYGLIPSSPEEAILWKEFQSAWEAFRVENDKYFALSRELEATSLLDPAALLTSIDRFRGDHFRLVSRVSRAVLASTPLEEGGDPGRCGFGEWLASFQTKNPVLSDALKRALPVHEAFHRAVKKVQERTAAGDRQAASALVLEELIPASEAMVPIFDLFTAEIARADELYRKMHEQALVHTYVKQKEALPMLDRLIQLHEKEAADAARTADLDGRRVKTLAQAGMGIGAVVALALGLILSLAISRPIQRATAGLIEGSNRVASASSQVASESLQLAEGASEQAAAIEQTSASLEEIAAMSRRNAESSSKANALMAETSRVIDEAEGSMQQLIDSMGEISRASEETHRIVKTIDEIAFQTNLLALNAAIEAARAGEAGTGFAVVADEVRNLALRAAEAARNTAGLIESTVGRVKNGTELAVNANSDFTRVAQGSRRVAELINDVHLASGEQSLGVEQVTQAVAQMDAVTQRNAASAEQSASAAEEMNAQAGQMSQLVLELKGFIHGGLGDRNGRPEEDHRAESARWLPGPETLGATGSSLTHDALLEGKSARLETGLGERSLVRHRGTSASPNSHEAQVLEPQAAGPSIRSVAHDLNNSLGVIIGYTGLALDGIPQASPVSGQLEYVLKAADRARDLVKQIPLCSRSKEVPSAPWIHPIDG